MPLLLSPLLSVSFFLFCLPISNWILCQTRFEKEREKASVRQLFTKSFKDLQVVSQRLLETHKAGTLTALQLGKEAKAINKSAKVLRTLLALGELVEEPALFEAELRSPAEFNNSLQQLSTYIYDFSHSPHHKNHRVFNMVEATKVHKDLVSIIHLSKNLETQAKYYSKNIKKD